MCIKVLRVHVWHHGYQPTQHVPFLLLLSTYAMICTSVNPSQYFVTWWLTCAPVWLWKVAVTLMCRPPAQISIPQRQGLRICTVSRYLQWQWLAQSVMDHRGVFHSIPMVSVGTVDFTIHQLCRVLLFVVFWDRVSLWSSRCPQTHRNLPPNAGIKGVYFIKFLKTYLFCTQCS